MLITSASDATLLQHAGESCINKLRHPKSCGTAVDERCEADPLVS